LERVPLENGVQVLALAEKKGCHLLPVERADLLRRYAKTIDMPRLSTACAVTAALGIAGMAAHARALRVEGTAGYLSEWKFSGEVSRGDAPDSDEHSGPMIWKHVGLCSVAGPQEKPGEIRIQLSKLGALSQITAIVSFEGAQCVYRGKFSGNSAGYMDCPDSKGVSFSISIKWTINWDQSITGRSKLIMSCLHAHVDSRELCGKLGDDGMR
jgi:hypothetical protein